MTQCFSVCIMDLLAVLLSFMHVHRSYVPLNKVILVDVVIAKAPNCPFDCATLE